ncbi:hypothetical protein BC830DRAFT_8728 [Chytriomyces sp. MP71]|nr:hypothetical protein BC830DRAFT_8728 [Chytriomyces sp. MP71]
MTYPQTLPKDVAVLRHKLETQVVPILQSHLKGDQTLEWFTDALVYVLVGTLLEGKVWETDVEFAMSLFELLRSSLFCLSDEALSCTFDTLKYYGNAINWFLNNKNVVNHLKDTLTVDFVANWAPLCSRFDFGSILQHRIREAGLELPPELATLTERFPPIQRENYEAHANNIPVSIVLDDAAPPQARRRALANVITALGTLTASNASAAEQETAAAVIERFAGVAADLVRCRHFPFMTDQWVSITTRVSELLKKEIMEANEAGWYIEASLFVIMQAREGDTGIMDSPTKVMALVTSIQDVAKYSPENADMVAGQVFELFKAGRLSSMDGYMVCAQLGPVGTSASLQNIDLLLQVSKSGEEMGLSMICRMLMAQHPVAFLPHLSEILDNPTFAPIMLIQAIQKPEYLRLDDVPKLLKLLKDATAGSTAAMCIEAIVKANPAAFEKEVDSLITKLTAPDVNIVSFSPVAPTVINIVAAITSGSNEGCVNATRVLFGFLDQILNASPRHAKANESVLAILAALVPIAEFHSDVLSSYENKIEELKKDPIAMQGQITTLLDQILNSLHGVSLASLSDKFSSSMKSLGINPDDPFFEAVKNSLDSGVVKEYDCMLSYNWNQQPQVIKIRDSLQQRGFTVWLDLEQMSGNVYAKMADAVLGSRVVIPCLSKSYEESGNCKRELGFAADQTRSGKKIVPVRFEDGPFTWTALITSGLLYTFISGHETHDEWEKSMDNLAKEISAVVGPRAPAVSAVSDTQEALFETAISEALSREARVEFDCMLSYNWSHQEVVIRIRDSLEQRGLSCWMDIDQMSGNVYAKMAEAVLGAHVIVPCITAAYEASGNCKRELNFAIEQVSTGIKKIVPVEIEDGPFTWTVKATESFEKVSVTKKEWLEKFEWERAMDSLAGKIKAALGGLLVRTSADASTSVVTSVALANAPSTLMDLQQFAALQARVVQLEARLQATEVAREKDKADFAKTLAKQNAFIKSLADFMGLKAPVL